MEYMKTEEILADIDKMFPDAHCELNHRNNYEMAVAVILSAQTTDASVNRVTPALFERYPDAESLAAGELEDIEHLISSLGLYRNKAKAIKGFAEGITAKFGGEVPDHMKDLVSLPGVGRKCANVILSECFGIPALAVDTHVSRIAKRLRLAKPDDPVDTIERKLKRKVPRERWIKTHHQLIFFGRYYCRAKNPACSNCPFKGFCREYTAKKTSEK